MTSFCLCGTPVDSHEAWYISCGRRVAFHSLLASFLRAIFYALHQSQKGNAQLWPSLAFSQYSSWVQLSNAQALHTSMQQIWNTTFHWQAFLQAQAVKAIGLQPIAASKGYNKHARLVSLLIICAHWQRHVKRNYRLDILQA